MRAGDLTNRAKRTAIRRVPVVRELAERRDLARLSQHRPHLPALRAGAQHLLQGLEAEGVVLTDLTTLDADGTEEMWQGLTVLTEDLKAAAVDGASTVRPSRERLLERAAVWRWGLDERLLDLVEQHIGLPVRYYGADVRCERANGEVTGVRRWHLDCEDRRMVKVLVWLNDVEDADGPFEYVPRGFTAPTTRALRYVSGYVTDASMSSCVPPEHWRRATGSARTAVVADTANVFHRALPPVARDRWSVTYTWTSRRPMRTYASDGYPEHLRAALVDGLSGRQMACLPAGVAPGVPHARRAR